MSRYQVDRVLREVVLSQETAQAFRSGPEAFLADRDLDPRERDALARVDYPTLYAMGAHPFLLTGFVMSVWSGDRRALQTQYSASLAPLGYPDFTT